MPLELEEVDEPDELGAAPPELLEDCVEGVDEPLFELEEFEPQAAAAKAARTTRQVAIR